MDENHLRSAMAALGHATRFALVERIASAGPEGAQPSVLADDLGLDRNLISAHLLVLTTAGLIQADRDGRRRNYRVVPRAFEEVAQWCGRVVASEGDETHTVGER